MPTAFLETRRAVLIYVAAGASFAALAARGLLVPLYAHQLGATRFEVGALFAVSTVAGAALSLPAGVLIDRFGPRNMLVLSFAMSAASQLATALTVTVPPLFVWQVAGGAAAGVQQAATFSAVTEAVSDGRLGRSMGWLTFSMQSGFFVGPLIAGVLLKWLDFPTDIAVTTIVIAAAIPGAIAAGGSRQHLGRGLSLSEPLHRLVRQPSFGPVTVGVIAASLIWGTVQAFLPVFAKESLGLQAYLVGYLVAVQAVANGASRPFAGRIVDRARRRWPVVFTGVVVFAAATAVLGHLSGFVAPAILLVVSTPFIAIAFVALGVVFADLSAGSTRGVTMGMYGTVLFVGLSAGPLAFGPVVQSAGYAAGFTVCAIAAALLAAAMAVLQAEPVRRRLELALPRPDPRA